MTSYRITIVGLLAFLLFLGISIPLGVRILGFGDWGSSGLVKPGEPVRIKVVYSGNKEVAELKVSIGDQLLIGEDLSPDNRVFEQEIDKFPEDNKLVSYYVGYKDGSHIEVEQRWMFFGNTHVQISIDDDGRIEWR